MLRLFFVLCLSFVPIFFYSQLNVFDDIKLGQNKSLKWSDIDYILQMYDFVILYVADESNSHKQKIEFIKNEFNLDDDIAFVWIVAERMEGGDEVRKILDDNLTINSCFLISRYQSYLAGTTRFVEPKQSARSGTYLYKYLKNRCVVDKLNDFKYFFNSGEGKTAIENYEHNKEVLELYQMDCAIKGKVDNSNVVTKTYVDSLSTTFKKSYDRTADVCLSTNLVFWKAYGRNFIDGVGSVSNSFMSSMIISKKMDLGDASAKSIKPTIDFGLGLAVERASTKILREKSRLGLLNGDERFPVLISDEVQSKIKGKALVFPVEFGIELGRKSEKRHWAFFSALGWWTMLKQLSVGDFYRESSDLFILDSSSGLEIRDINILSQFSQMLTPDERNEISISALANLKFGLSYASKRFSCAFSYSLFKSVINNSITGSYLPVTDVESKLFNESHNWGNAIGLGISYKL